MPNKTTKDVRLYQEAAFKLLDIEVQEGHRADTSTDNTDKVLIIEGYATVVSNPDGSKYIDRDGEHVAIDLLKTSNYLNNPVIVFNHDWGTVVGKCLELVKDAKGVRVKAEIHKLTGLEHIYEAVEKGLIVTFSIGFIPSEFTYLEAEDAFEISSAELIEISLAPVPANGASLFSVTGTKDVSSLTIEKSLVQEQTGMSCDELKGICTITKNIKGKTMSKKEQNKDEVIPEEQKPQEDVKQETSKEPQPEPKKEEKVEVEVAEPKKDEQKEPKLSVEDLAAEIVRANKIAEEEKAKAEQERKEKAEQEIKEKEEAEKRRVEEALAYIKQRKEDIEKTPASELDVDELDSFYELLSDTVDIINGKVIEAVTSVEQ